MNTTGDDRPIDELSFEEALERLEEVALALEQGEVALEEALQRYEYAMQLKERLLSQLQAAEEKVKKAIQAENGDVQVGEFDVNE